MDMADTSTRVLTSGNQGEHDGYGRYFNNGPYEWYVISLKHIYKCAVCMLINYLVLRTEHLCLQSYVNSTLLVPMTGYSNQMKAKKFSKKRYLFSGTTTTMEQYIAACTTATDTRRHTNHGTVRSSLYHSHRHTTTHQP